MKKRWFYYTACLIFPHIMLIAGLIMLTRKNIQQKALGKRLCIISSVVLVAGSIIYYIYFTPIFGLD